MKKYTPVLLLCLTIFLSLGLEAFTLQIHCYIPSHGVINYPTSNMFGVNLPLYDYFWNAWSLEKRNQLLDLMKNLGMKYIRIFPDESHVRPIVDEVVSMARARDMEIIPMFGTAKNRFDNNLETFKTYVRTMMQNYAFPIVHLGHEPGVNWDAPDTMEGWREYVQWMRAASEVIRGVKPDCTVLISYGYGKPFRNDQNYNLPKLLQADPHYPEIGDGITIHPYPFHETTPAPYDPIDFWNVAITELRSYLADKGYPDYPIYCTEFGFSILEEEVGGVGSLENQAKCTERFLTLLMKKDVKMALYWHMYGFTKPEWGLLEVTNIRTSSPSFTPRPVYYTYQNFVRAHI